MTSRLPAVVASLLTLTASAVAATVATALPAQAALSCASDPYEANDAGTGAPIAVGGSVTRAICQDREAGVDREYFSFDAVGGKAYSAFISAAGSGLAFGQLNGLEVAGVFKVEADGSWTVIDSPNAQSFERFTTPVLAAGRYVFVAVDGDEITYPDFYSGTKPVDGQAGVYTMKVEVAANAPGSITSLTVPATVKARESSTGSYVLSGPAPVGGMSLYVEGRGGNISIGRIWVPAGASRGTFPISIGPATKGTVFTITATTRIGGSITKTTTVK